MPNQFPLRILCIALALGVAGNLSAQGNGSNSAPAQSAASAGISKQVGTIKAINGNAITLATDAGAEIAVAVESSARLLRTAPGQKDLSSATPIQIQDLQVGDRILARGKASDDGKGLSAATIIVMKGSEIAAKQQQDREEWQKHGIGGIVTAVDAAAATITVSTGGLVGSKPITVHVAKDTILRRYAPNSVKFDDATAGTLGQIKVGDQLRARGTRSADGSELAAAEVVSGAFRSIAATVVAADPSDNSLRVMDLATKKPMTLKISGDSQLRSLPPIVAQRIAMRLKGGSNGTPGAQNAPPGTQTPPPTSEKPGESHSGAPGGRPGGPPDFQQMLARMPAVNLSDLQKGTPVMVVATEGTESIPPTAITLLTGVEPILTASPDSGRAAMLLSPWNLGGAGDAAAGGGNP